MRQLLENHSLEKKTIDENGDSLKSSDVLDVDGEDIVDVCIFDGSVHQQ